MASVAASTNPDTNKALHEVGAGLADAQPSLVFVFHSPCHDPDVVATGIKMALPDATTVGCTTYGEVGPMGFTRGGMSAFGLRPKRFAVHWIEDLTQFRFADGVGLVGQAAAEMGLSPAGLCPQEHVFVTLTDGMGGAVGRLAAALAHAAPKVGIIGGLAGDDGRFESTWTWCNGKAAQGSALVVLMEPGVPFVPFAVHHYTAMSQAFVVTDCDAESNLIFGLDGRPAVEVYAQITGLPADAIVADPGLIWGQPWQFGVSAGDGFHVRAVLSIEQDGLLMGGPVHKGMVLRVAHARECIDATRSGIGRVLSSLPAESDGMLLFNCAGRLAEASSALPALFEASAAGVPVAGCSTYGEHFGPLVVNHSLTGVAFGGESGR